MVISLIVRMGMGVHFAFGFLEVVTWFDSISLLPIHREGILGPGGGMRRSNILPSGILYGVRGVLPQKFQDVEVFLPLLVEFLVADGGPLPLDAFVHI
jgi:hypothetical protein